MNVSTGGSSGAQTRSGGISSSRRNKEQSCVEQFAELVVPGPDEKNWRGIGIALVVIVCVCALIVTAVVLLTPGEKESYIGKKKITLEEVLSGDYNYRTFNGSWLSDHEFLYQDEFGALEVYNVVNNTHQIFVSNATLKHHHVSRYYLSPDRQFLLLARHYRSVFRYTYKSAFLLYNISSENVSPLFPESADLLLQYASWGPTGNQLVYVLNNNIYYMPSIKSEPYQLTSNGVNNVIYNGIPDWVYEEEILASSHALWFSEDGKKLCFATFNDTDVEEITYPYYGSYTDIKNVYPETITLKYPKPGRANPTVTLWVADLTSTRPVPRVVKPPKEYEDLEYYFTVAQWADNKTLCITWVKRSQDNAIISICQESGASWTCNKNHEESSVGEGWVDFYANMVFTEDSKYYFVILPGPPEDSAGRFRHVSMINVKTGKIEFLTSGKYDVTDILQHSKSTRTLYYISTLEGKASQRHLFSVTDLTHTTPKQVVCITCDLNPDCLYNSARFAPDSLYYILQCLGPGIPRVELRSIASKEPATVFDTNEDLKELLDTRAVPKVKRLQVELPGNYLANVELLLPPGLREDEITKYPLLLQVYSGPGSQMVKDMFSVTWGTYLASKKNVIYAVVDGRGSGNNGNKILHELYRRLGTVEVADQIAVIRYLRDNLPYIDESKIAVFGWSYGGFVTATILATDDDVFQCGISVAPVTSWLYYDSVYTERYMQLPTSSDNLAAYEKSEVMKKAENFKGKKFLLVHGSADDNVHWQQSAMLAKSLTNAGVIFRMQVYPDERHGLSNVKMHLYETVVDFLDHCYIDDDSSVESSDS